jgi:hypothetical protein
VLDFWKSNSKVYEKWNETFQKTSLDMLATLNWLKIVDS